MRDWGDTAVITRYGLGVRVMSCRRIWQPSAGRWYRCRIPDDCIDLKRYPLLMARAVLQELIESLQSPLGVKPC